ncbi:MAG TPA: hypothetical protein VGM88_09615 [Kofleriaceae bacterium]|jgi:anti-sigma factor RsiW
MTEQRNAEADRLIADAIADRMPAAPARLRAKLAREHLRRRRPIGAWLGAFAAGALASAVVLLLWLHAPGATATDVIAREAANDHLRILVATRPLDVEVSDMHQVKPWFAGKLEFVPPVSFLGDDEFALRGGDLVVFDGHKAAAFVYQRRLHVISLFVFPEPDAAARSETTVRGFHVLRWHAADTGFALVSDVNWDDLRTLEARLR